MLTRVYIFFLTLAGTATISVPCASGSVDSVDGTPSSELSVTATIQADNANATATTIWTGRRRPAAPVQALGATSCAPGRSVPK